jgi:hypothetical protein
MNYYLTPSLDFQDGISGAKEQRKNSLAINISPRWREATILLVALPS